MSTYYDVITNTNVPACADPHMLHVGCAYCTADALNHKTYDEVTNWFVQGIIGEDALDAYRHVWATSATRSAAYDHFRELPETDEARAIALILRSMTPSGRGYC